jgi:Raf kinase inhibitor-like YbhB/YbcL family protein
VRARRTRADAAGRARARIRRPVAAAHRLRAKRRAWRHDGGLARLHFNDKENTMPSRSRSLTLAALLATTALGTASAAGFHLMSPTIKPGSMLSDEQVFNGFGCTGKNVSPALKWSGAPKDTKSFALTVYDPDAPTGSGWWHWVVYNIPASASELAEGAGTADGKGLPAGSAQGNTDFGAPGFGGACPPKGDKPHRYIFTIYALKTDKLDIPAGGTAALVGFMINANKLGSATFMAKYGRSK